MLRSKVSRLTERLRKRYPTNNYGMPGEGGLEVSWPWGRGAAF